MLVVPVVALKTFHQFFYPVDVYQLTQSWHSEKPRELYCLSRVLGSRFKENLERKNGNQVDPEPSPEIVYRDHVVVLNNLVCFGMFIRLEKRKKEIQYKHKRNDKVKVIETGIWRESIGKHENIPDARVSHEKENPNVEY